MVQVEWPVIETVGGISGCLQRIHGGSVTFPSSRNDQQVRLPLRSLCAQRSLRPAIVSDPSRFRAARGVRETVFELVVGDGCFACGA